MTRAEISIMIRHSVQIVNEPFRRTRHRRRSLVEQWRRDVGSEIEAGERVLDLSFHLSMHRIISAVRGTLRYEETDLIGKRPLERESLEMDDQDWR